MKTVGHHFQDTNKDGVQINAKENMTKKVCTEHNTRGCCDTAIPRDDRPHSYLLRDLSFIIAEAEGFEFHDFKNTKYPAPKRELIAQLTSIINNVKNGDYDN